MDYCERQRERKAVSAFAALIAIPATGAFTVPAGARISFASSAGSTEGDTLAELVGSTNRTIKAKTLVASEKQILDFVERGVVITPSSGIDVYVDQGLARWAKIAEG